MIWNTGVSNCVPFDITCIDMCTFESSEIRTPPQTGRLTVVPMVSLLYRLHCIFTLQCGDCRHTMALNSPMQTVVACKKHTASSVI